MDMSSISLYDSLTQYQTYLDSFAEKLLLKEFHNGLNPCEYSNYNSIKKYLRCIGQRIKYSKEFAELFKELNIILYHYNEYNIQQIYEKYEELQRGDKIYAEILIIIKTIQESLLSSHSKSLLNIKDLKKNIYSYYIKFLNQRSDMCICHYDMNDSIDQIHNVMDEKDDNKIYRIRFHEKITSDDENISYEYIIDHLKFKLIEIFNGIRVIILKSLNTEEIMTFDDFNEGRKILNRDIQNKGKIDAQSGQPPRGKKKVLSVRY